MEYKKNLATGTIMSLASIAYLVSASQVEVFTGSGASPLSAQFVPYLWGGSLLILSLIVLCRGIKQKKAVVQMEEKREGSNLFANNYEVILTFVFLAIYIALLQPIGFLIMSAVYMTAQILLLTAKEKRSKRMIIITVAVAIVLAFVIDYIFVCLLNVMLPLGIFGF